MHLEIFALIPCHQIADLPLRSHIRREGVEGGGFDEHPEDGLAQLFGEEILGNAPAGIPPGRREEEYHRLATVGGLFERFLPALAGRDAPILREIEKIVVPAVSGEPFGDGLGRRAVGAGMAEEDLGHGFRKPLSTGSPDTQRSRIRKRNSLLFRFTPFIARHSHNQNCKTRLSYRAKREILGD
uniref:Uncharacterized protein n=1 Tax=Candidatus Kentrum sp. TUN TaxID=2126343 RepID=A0A450ZLT0_9GAMM|nr:MAG: hypothetical protein BECKTUN1418F_GA0071002_10551 [Candidatus Kentron sp. TUN]VFK59172.1 MAG: hypothetical protein BECKTUN1418E_GA0071001_10521 [Candidatus Kentron sp. TUN]